MGWGAKVTWWRRAKRESDDLPWLTHPTGGPLMFDPSLKTAGELLAEKRSAEAAATSPRAA